MFRMWHVLNTLHTNFIGYPEFWGMRVIDKKADRSWSPLIGTKPDLNTAIIHQKAFNAIEEFGIVFYCDTWLFLDQQGNHGVEMGT